MRGDCSNGGSGWRGDDPGGRGDGDSDAGFKLRGDVTGRIGDGDRGLGGRG